MVESEINVEEFNAKLNDFEQVISAFKTRKADFSRKLSEALSPEFEKFITNLDNCETPADQAIVINSTFAPHTAKALELLQSASTIINDQDKDSDQKISDIVQSLNDILVTKSHEISRTTGGRKKSKKNKSKKNKSKKSKKKRKNKRTFRK
jgi:hypothetical protein